MALNPQVLTDGFKELGNKAANGDTNLSWNDFCDVINDYLSDIEYPRNFGVTTGVQALKSTLSVLNNNNGTLAPVLLSQGFIQLGVTLATSDPVPVGSAPGQGSGVFPSVPPPVPPVFTDIFSKTNDLDTYASLMSSRIDTWIRTGLYDVGQLVPAAPSPIPVPVPSPWL